MQTLITAGYLSLYFLRDEPPSRITLASASPSLTDHIGWPLFSVDMHPLRGRPVSHPCDNAAYQEAYRQALRLYPR